MYEGTMTSTATDSDIGERAMRAKLDAQRRAALDYNRARRRVAHAWLCVWGRERERIGSVGGVLAKVRELGDGAGATAGRDHSAPNPIERQCDKLQRTLRIEHFVRQMDRDWIMVLFGKYVHGETSEQVATRLGVERSRVTARLEDAQDRLMREFDADQACAARDFNHLLQSGFSSVESGHPAVGASSSRGGKPA